MSDSLATHQYVAPGNQQRLPGLRIHRGPLQLCNLLLQAVRCPSMCKFYSVNVINILPLPTGMRSPINPIYTDIRSASFLATSLTLICRSLYPFLRSRCQRVSYRFSLPCRRRQGPRSALSESCPGRGCLVPGKATLLLLQQ